MKTMKPITRFRLLTRASQLGIAIPMFFAGAESAAAQQVSQAPPENVTDSVSSNDGVNSGDIIVTAQRRAQRLNDVGLTINVISSEELKSNGIADPADLVRVTPGLDVGRTATGYPTYSLRGVNFNSVVVSGAPAVTAYIDEAPLPYAIMWGGLLLDVDRVEVLKGPQGTLYGQNATGGSINVAAAKPTTRFGTGGQIDIDEFGRVQAQAYLSGGLSDDLRARVAVAADEGGAWQRGYVTTDRKLGRSGQLSGRVLLEWTPSSDVRFLANVNGSTNTGQPQAFQLRGYNPGNPAAGNPVFNQFIATNARQAEVTGRFRLDNYSWQTALRGEWDFAPNASLISVTNFVKARALQDVDYDGTSIAGLEGDQLGRAKSFTQELRITGKLPDADLDYIVGVYYQKDKLLDDVLAVAQGITTAPPGLAFRGRYPQTNRAFGIFANADWEVVSGLTFTGGARYTKSRQTERGCTLPGDAFSATLLGSMVGQCVTFNDVVPPTDPGFFQPITPDFKQTQNEDNVSWRAGVNYKPTRDLLLYGLISRGYKAGSFNVGIPFLVSGLSAAKQEQLTAYEVGTKASLIERVLNLNLSAFHYDYRDKQFQTYTATPLGANFILTNIPKSKVTGVDAELTATLGDLTLNGGLTYVDTKVGSFQTLDITLNAIDVTGNRFNLAPKVSATFGASYRPEISTGLRGLLAINGLYHSSTNSDLVQTATLRIPAYTVLDATVGVASDDGWRLNLWVRNFTDKYYATTTAASADFSLWLAGRPRTFGVTLGYDFR